MLDHISGKVHGISEDAAVLSVGGVGIRVEMSTLDLAKLSGEATVYTVLQIREEEVHLYGFRTEHAREMFRMLTSVAGVGAKVALGILSAFSSVDALERAIGTGDEGALLAVSGVGKKIAGRIVLELRDKVGVISEAIAATNGNSPLAEVREGLKNLGYSANEIQSVLTTLPTDGDSPTLLRHALRALGSERTGVNN